MNHYPLLGRSGLRVSRLALGTMNVDTAGPALRGRRRERDTLDRLLRDVRAGHSRVLVLRGEAGAGKTALLDYLTENAPASRVTRAAGVEPESEIAYSALQQLCAPLLGHLNRLPEPQRAALATAFGLSLGNPPEALLIGLAVLGLFAEVALEQPLVCVVDDVQWLDRMSEVILTFVARRLDAESVALVFASRSPGDERILDGLPELRVDGLSDADARALLDSVLPDPVDARVRDRIVAETRGNPLALLELPRGLTPAELAFGFGAQGTAPLVSRVEEGFQRRIVALPADTRRLLLTAAVEPIGDVPLLWRALERLGIGPDAAAPAEAAGLVELGTRVRFRHPLVRSASWRSGEAAELREVHRALAEVTDAEQDPDRRAWHRAHATVGPDEEVASELQRSAGRPLARGGRSAAASFLERAVELTADPKRRAARALAAARARFAAGAPAQVPDAAGRCRAGSARPVAARRGGAFAGAGRLRAQPRTGGRPAATRGRPPARGARSRPRRRRPTSWRWVLQCTLAGSAATTSAGPPRPPAACPPTRTWPVCSWPALRRGAWTATRLPFRFSAGPWTRSPRMRICPFCGWPGRSRTRCGTTRPGTGSPSKRSASPAPPARCRFCPRRWCPAPARCCTRAGSPTPRICSMRPAPSDRPPAWPHIRPPRSRWPLTAAGKLPALELIEATVEDADARGEGWLLGLAGYTKAVLSNGLGHYPAALEAARQAAEYEDLALFNWTLGELVEAAARVGERAVAAEARERLAERTGAAGTDWAFGAQALADALAGPSEKAEERYREAIERLAASRIGLQLARARLLYGEWLRRENRRNDARIQLRTAHEAFTTMGAEGFAERAGRELVAAGETVRKRTVGVWDDLTSQEAQSARLAAAGHTNPEIGAVLFLSPRTVEWHLRKVFTKLGISSRRELAGALRDR